MGFITGFNPCFNGYSTLTAVPFISAILFTGFNPCFNGYSTLTLTNKLNNIYTGIVSILVLMDTLL